MQVTRKEVEKVAVSSLGARVGDQVIFSSHHPRNIKEKDYMASCGVYLDKLYPVVAVDNGARSYIETELSHRASWGCHDYYSIGHFDIIIPAPQQEAKFEPLVLTLETQGEIDLIFALVGATPPSIGNKFEVSTIAIYRNLEDHCKSGVRFETIKVRS